ncbi:MAG: sigma-70 family RNA polymerase sigma factor [Clostridia bacterium]|nr:sigma-70 family RNA polymerase sigma factor [Clostridia bacterium]
MRMRIRHHPDADKGRGHGGVTMDDARLIPLLADYAANRAPDVMAQLVEGYLPLCRSIARRFIGQGVEREDLEQVAAMALMKAIERFEPERGFKFSTFAMPTIAGEVRNYIRDKGSAIRVSRDTRTRLYQLKRATDALEQQLRREPTLREIAEYMQITPEELLSLLDARDTQDTLSMDAPMSSDEDAQRLEERLGVAESGYEAVEQKQWMQWILQQVTPQEKTLLEKRYIERLGQRDTARALGLSQMQVSRMERKLLTRLRAMTDHWQAVH